MAVYARPRPTGAMPARAPRAEGAGACSLPADRWRSLAWALRSFVVAPFSIPSGSMLPTLYIGDYLSSPKWPYGYSRYSFPFGIPAVQRTDLRHLPAARRRRRVPPSERGRRPVKRVIGLPGDTVAVAAAQLILNGQPRAAASARAFAMPITPTALPGRAAGDADRSVDRGTAGVLRLSRLSRDAARRPELHSARPGRRARADDFAADQGARRPRLPDGRQSRRQPRQPLFRRGRRASAWSRSRI